MANIIEGPVPNFHIVELNDDELYVLRSALFGAQAIKTEVLTSLEKYTNHAKLAECYRKELETIATLIEDTRVS